MISRNIGLSLTLYSRNRLRGRQALTCRLAADSRSVNQAWGQTSTPGAFGLPNDLADLAQPAASAQIRLDHVHLALVDQLMETPGRGLLFAGGQPRLHSGLFHAGVAFVAFRVQKVLQPEDLIGLQLPQQFDGIVGAAVDAPAGVDQ